MSSSESWFANAERVNPPARTIVRWESIPRVPRGRRVRNVKQPRRNESSLPTSKQYTITKCRQSTSRNCSTAGPKFPTSRTPQYPMHDQYDRWSTKHVSPKMRHSMHSPACHHPKSYRSICFHPKTLLVLNTYCVVGGSREPNWHSSWIIWVCCSPSNNGVRILMKCHAS